MDTPKDRVLRPADKRQGGFTLIEVLVSMVIVAVGILGIAALQYRGMQFTYDAYLRSQASIALFDLADKVRAAPKTARTGLVTAINGHTAAATTVSCTVTIGVAITNQDYANCWKTNFNRQFPAGTKVEVSSAEIGSTAVFNYTATIISTDKQGGERRVSYAFTI